MLHHCHAYDLLVVEQPDGSLSASQALVYFGHDMRSAIDLTKFELALVLVRETQAFCHPFGADQRFDDGTLCAVGTKLRLGRNAARMLLIDRATGDIRGLAPMNVFLWRAQDPVAVVDVDGTITKSSLSGFWHTAVRQDFHSRHCHPGVCPFVHALALSASIQQQEQDDATTTTTTMNILYLTNRPITYASETRDFLTSVRQQETNLPPGLLVGFIGTITGVLKVRRHGDVCWCCPGRLLTFLTQSHCNRWTSIVVMLTCSRWKQSKSTSSPLTRPLYRGLSLDWATPRPTCGVTTRWASDACIGSTTNRASMHSLPRTAA
jgi:hypothetical protein